MISCQVSKCGRKERLRIDRPETLVCNQEATERLPGTECLRGSLSLPPPPPPPPPSSFSDRGTKRNAQIEFIAPVTCVISAAVEPVTKFTS